MDGTLAGIFVIASLTDMTLNHCPTGCTTATQDRADLSFQLAAVEFDRRIIGEELALSYAYPVSFGPWQPIAMISATDKGRIWAGAGARWQADLGDTGAFVEASLMPGYDSGGDGPDIGGRIQFRSAVGIGFRFDNGASLTASYDHRSNSELQDLNPGLETISIRYGIALK